MIPKKEGNFNVEHLRTILLYDTEFNGLLKWLGRELMRRAERMDALAVEQYGSRAGLAAIFQSLNMQLFWMSSVRLRYQRQYVRMMPNHATTESSMVLLLWLFLG